jgi:glycine betaine catabolism B
MKTIDSLLDRITMYRLVLYVLLCLIGMAVLLAFFHRLSFTPLELLFSAAFLVVICWAANTIFAVILKVPTNVESALITALILALIIDPAKSLGDLQFLGWAGILSMASKYLLALSKKHLFNPAAIAVVITAFVMQASASWWVGTVSMLPAVLIGGLLVARKIRQGDVILCFCAITLLVLSAAKFLQGEAIFTALTQILLQSPLFFFATIMLTEPLTAPPTRNRRRLYATLTGVCFVPLLHIGSIYSTPELALVVGNVFSYLVSPKQRVILKLAKRIKVTPYLVDFVFKPSQKLAFLPGQYMEFTLAHPQTDSRGNRRYFTLASSPTENVVHLGVRFYEKSSSFKRALYSIDGRTNLVAAQIAGDFTLPRNPEKKLVFLAGGIGITPFRSMLKYLLDTQQTRDIILFYTNKTVDEIAYKDVLGQAQTRMGVKIFYALTEKTALPRNWTGIKGRIDEQMLLKTIPDYLERIYYLSGPPEMVRTYEESLKKLQIKSSQIKKDFFPGLV